MEPLRTVARYSSIDLLRGLVMVLMALDHVRDYFHAAAFQFDPTDLDSTTIPIFLTRWITHYCAPVFVFLAGVSAWIVHQRQGTRSTSIFLLKRGLWLVAVEVLVVSLGWMFNLTYPILGLQVIWAIGMSMIVLAGLVWLPIRAIAIIGLLIVCGHNLLDDLHFNHAWWWMMLHDGGLVDALGRRIFFAYPLIPWIGTMALGFAFGQFYRNTVTPQQRSQLLLKLGIVITLLFVVLRLTNTYGDPRMWEEQASPAFTVLSFLDLTKYPPSLLYLLMTLGPAIIFLAVTERVRGSFANVIILFGRVPFFYYILHIYLIHAAALVAAELTGFGWRSMILDRPVWLSTELNGYGFSLPVVYLVWIAVVVALYPLCKWFDRVKSNNRQIWWLRYL